MKVPSIWGWYEAIKFKKTFRSVLAHRSHPEHHDVDSFISYELRTESAVLQIVDKDLLKDLVFLL